MADEKEPLEQVSDEQPAEVQAEGAPGGEEVAEPGGEETAEQPPVGEQPE